MTSLPDFPRRRTLVTLTLLTALIPALIGAVVMYSGEQAIGIVVSGLLSAMLPPALIVGLLTRHPTWTVIGLVQGYALSGVLAIVGIAAVLAWGGQAESRLWLLVAGLIAIGVPVFARLYLVARRAGFESFGEHRIAPGLAGIVGMWILFPVADALVTRVFAASPSIVPGSDVTAENGSSRSWASAAAELRPIVYQVQACAFRHAATRPGIGYPRTLAEMGPSGDRCLPRKIVNGDVHGMTLEYALVAGDSADSSATFIVRATVPTGSGTLSAVGDTSGLIREREVVAGDVPPSDEDHRVADGAYAVYVVGLIRNCALLANALTGDATAPASLAEIASPVVRRQVNENLYCDQTRMRSIAKAAGRGGFTTPGGYRITYAARGARNPTDFTIVARPVEYGESGIRSYRLRGDGELHVTTEDRPATAFDPTVPACEDAGGWNGRKPLCVVLP